MKNLAVYLFLCFAWGTSWMVIKFSNAAFPPLLGASFRFWLSGAILLVTALLAGKLQRLTKSDLWLLFMTGLLTFNVGYGLVYISEVHIDSAIVATIFGTFPIFCAFLGHFMVPDEKLGKLGFLGVLTAFLGVLALSLTNMASMSLTELTWILLTLLSPFACALNVVMIKKDGGNLNPFTLNIIPMLLGGVGLSILSLLYEKGDALTLTPSGLAALAYLSIVVTVLAFSFYYWLLKRISLVLISSTAYISLVIAILSGYLVLGEEISQERIIGVVLILIGVFLVQRDQMVMNNDR